MVPGSCNGEDLRLLFSEQVTRPEADRQAVYSENQGTSLLRYADFGGVSRASSWEYDSHGGPATVSFEQLYGTS